MVGNWCSLSKTTAPGGQSPDGTDARSVGDARPRFPKVVGQNMPKGAKTIDRMPDESYELHVVSKVPACVMSCQNLPASLMSCQDLLASLMSRQNLTASLMSWEPLDPLSTVREIPGTFRQTNPQT